MFNGLFFDDEDASDAFNLFTRGQVEDAIAPRTAPEGLEFAMTQAQKSPTLPTPPMSEPIAPQTPNAPRGLSSPHTMAGMGAAINNIMRMRRGGMPTQNPIAAYQESVLREKNQRIREAADKRAQEQHDRQQNPFWAYEEAKKRGHIPPETTYEQWVQIARKGFDSTAHIKNHERWKELNPQKPGESDEEYARKSAEAFADIVEKSNVIDAGGGGKIVFNPLKGIYEVVTPTEATQRNANEAGAVETATQQAKTREEQVREGINTSRGARLAYQSAEQMLNTTQEWLDRFESDEEIDTGFITGMLARFGIGEENIAELNADAIYAALQNLQITNLAPVTEQEFAAVMQMWADYSKSPTMIKGSLQSALRRTENLMEMIRSDAIYGAGLVETYGTPAQYDALLRSNPFVGGLMRPEQTTPDPAPDSNKITGPSRPGG